MVTRGRPTRARAMDAESRRAMTAARRHRAARASARADADARRADADAKAARRRARGRATRGRARASIRATIAALVGACVVMCVPRGGCAAEGVDAHGAVAKRTSTNTKSEGVGGMLNEISELVERQRAFEDAHEGCENVRLVLLEAPKRGRVSIALRDGSKLWQRFEFRDAGAQTTCVDLSEPNDFEITTAGARGDDDEYSIRVEKETGDALLMRLGADDENGEAHTTYAALKLRTASGKNVGVLGDRFESCEDVVVDTAFARHAGVARSMQHRLLDDSGDLLSKWTSHATGQKKMCLLRGRDYTLHLNGAMSRGRVDDQLAVRVTREEGDESDGFTYLTTRSQAMVNDKNDVYIGVQDATQDNIDLRGVYHFHIPSACAMDEVELSVVLKASKYGDSVPPEGMSWIVQDEAGSLVMKTAKRFRTQDYGVTRHQSMCVPKGKYEFIAFASDKRGWKYGTELKIYQRLQGGKRQLLASRGGNEEASARGFSAPWFSGALISEPIELSVGTEQSAVASQDEPSVKIAFQGPKALLGNARFVPSRALVRADVMAIISACVAVCALVALHNDTKDGDGEVKISLVDGKANSAYGTDTAKKTDVGEHVSRSSSGKSHGLVSRSSYLKIVAVGASALSVMAIGSIGSVRLDETSRLGNSTVRQATCGMGVTKCQFVHSPDCRSKTMYAYRSGKLAHDPLLVLPYESSILDGSSIAAEIKFDANFCAVQGMKTCNDLGDTSADTLTGCSQACRAKDGCESFSLQSTVCRLCSTEHVSRSVATSTVSVARCMRPYQFAFQGVSLDECAKACDDTAACHGFNYFERSHAMSSHCSLLRAPAHFEAHVWRDSARTKSGIVGAATYYKVPSMGTLCKERGEAVQAPALPSGLGIGDSAVITSRDGYPHDDFYAGDKGYPNDEARPPNDDDSDFVADFMITSEIELIGVTVHSLESNDVSRRAFIRGLAIFFGITSDEVVIMDVTPSQDVGTSHGVHVAFVILTTSSHKMSQVVGDIKSVLDEPNDEVRLLFNGAGLTVTKATFQEPPLVTEQEASPSPTASDELVTNVSTTVEGRPVAPTANTTQTPSNVTENEPVATNLPPTSIPGADLAITGALQIVGYTPEEFDATARERLRRSMLTFFMAHNDDISIALMQNASLVEGTQVAYKMKENNPHKATIIVEALLLMQEPSAISENFLHVLHFKGLTNVQTSLTIGHPRVVLERHMPPPPPSPPPPPKTIVMVQNITKTINVVQSALELKGINVQTFNEAKKDFLKAGLSEFMSKALQRTVTSDLIRVLSVSGQGYIKYFDTNIVSSGDVAQLGISSSNVKVNYEVIVGEEEDAKTMALLNELSGGTSTPISRDVDQDVYPSEADAYPSEADAYPARSPPIESDDQYPSSTSNSSNSDSSLVTNDLLGTLLLDIKENGLAEVEEIEIEELPVAKKQEVSEQVEIEVLAPETSTPVTEEEELTDLNDDETIETNFLKALDEIKVLSNASDAEVYLVDSVLRIDGYDMNTFDAVSRNAFTAGMARFLGIAFAHVRIIDVTVVHTSTGRRLLTDLLDVEFVAELPTEESANAVAQEITDLMDSENAEAIQNELMTDLQEAGLDQVTNGEMTQVPVISSASSEPSSPVPGETPNAYPTQSPVPGETPNAYPTPSPNAYPTQSPVPGEAPNAYPTQSPVPGETPNAYPTSSPNAYPTQSPVPGEAPNAYPTQSPVPGEAPNAYPTPSPVPGETPNAYPTQSPVPGETPNAYPTQSPVPGEAPNAYPTPSPVPGETPNAYPTQSPVPGETPNAYPTQSPVPGEAPNAYPTQSPVPGEAPNAYPTQSPVPGEAPNAYPTPSPVPGETPNAYPTPSPVPGETPNAYPTQSPVPGETPNAYPTQSPVPGEAPNVYPTQSPVPGETPNAYPTQSPVPGETSNASPTPSPVPGETPNAYPTQSPVPGETPNAYPTQSPVPGEAPNAYPTPSPVPGETPNAYPTQSPVPGETPNAYPTQSPVPGEAPNAYPTQSPVPGEAPNAYPTQSPVPGEAPNAYPTPSPNAYPTPSPSAYPTPSPEGPCEAVCAALNSQSGPNNTASCDIHFGCVFDHTQMSGQGACISFAAGGDEPCPSRADWDAIVPGQDCNTENTPTCARLFYGDEYDNAVAGTLPEDWVGDWSAVPTPEPSVPSDSHPMTTCEAVCAALNSKSGPNNTASCDIHFGCVFDHTQMSGQGACISFAAGGDEPCPSRADWDAIVPGQDCNTENTPTCARLFYGDEYDNAVAGTLPEDWVGDWSAVPTPEPSVPSDSHPMTTCEAVCAALNSQSGPNNTASCDIHFGCVFDHTQMSGQGACISFAAGGDEPCPSRADWDAIVPGQDCNTENTPTCARLFYGDEYDNAVAGTLPEDWVGDWSAVPTPEPSVPSDSHPTTDSHASFYPASSPVPGETPNAYPTQSPVPGETPNAYPTPSPNAYPTQSPVPGEAPNAYPTQSPVPGEAPNAYPTPSPVPGETPNAYPTSSPNAYPTQSPVPGEAPNAYPTPSPNAYPTQSPVPGEAPNAYPTQSPVPGETPNAYPTSSPNAYPTQSPVPGEAPNAYPTPSPVPGEAPNAYPTPSPVPGETPNAYPTQSPVPGETPNAYPTQSPVPGEAPNAYPTQSPVPGETPNAYPTQSPVPGETPNAYPTQSPVPGETPNAYPTPSPSAFPTPSPVPSETPNAYPTPSPSAFPTQSPVPSETPNAYPTPSPSAFRHRAPCRARRQR